MKINHSFIILLIAIVGFTCKNDTILKKNNIQNIGKQVENKTYSKHLLNGVWAENEDENALFYIDNDSIYYVEHQDTTYAIDLIENQLIIYFEGYAAKSKILKLTSDSLIYEVDHETVKLYKRKD